VSSYKPDTECYKEVVAHFDPIAQEELGRKITNPTTEEIDRKTLGELVFGNDNRLQELQDLVWTRILQSLEPFTRRRLRNMERRELWKLLSSSRLLGWIICTIEVVDEIEVSRRGPI